MVDEPNDPDGPAGEKKAGRKKATKKAKKKTKKAGKKKAGKKSPKKKAGKKAGKGGPSEEQIRQRAYEIHQQRGGEHGAHEEDWHRARRELEKEAEGEEPEPK